MSVVSNGFSALEILTSAVIIGNIREFPDVSQPDCKADQREDVLYPVGPIRALKIGVAIVTTAFLLDVSERGIRPNRDATIEQMLASISVHSQIWTRSGGSSLQGLDRLNLE